MCIRDRYKTAQEAVKHQYRGNKSPELVTGVVFMAVIRGLQVNAEEVEDLNELESIESSSLPTSPEQGANPTYANKGTNSNKKQHRKTTTGDDISSGEANNCIMNTGNVIHELSDIGSYPGTIQYNTIQDNITDYTDSSIWDELIANSNSRSGDIKKYAVILESIVGWADTVFINNQNLKVLPYSTIHLFQGYKRVKIPYSGVKLKFINNCRVLDILGVVFKFQNTPIRVAKTCELIFAILDKLQVLTTKQTKVYAKGVCKTLVHLLAPEVVNDIRYNYQIC